MDCDPPKAHNLQAHSLRKRSTTVMTKLSATFQEAIANIWSPPGRSRIPDRVAKLIARNDDVSEILVKLIQLFVFALWAIFYLAAPKPDPDTVSQVPLVTSLYLILTIALLLLAMVRRTPDWLIYASIIIDMALLTYLIWSFHIQYGQPASFSLKVVEVMNYFVLISLRAIRFEARYVLAAGFAAAFSWTVMIIYTTTYNAGDAMITRDYVTYITSNSVLIGAEVSKIISMLMVSIVLAISVRRANSFLVTSISEGRAAKDLSRFLSVEVAEQIRDSNQKIEAGQGVRRDAVIMNIDIRGFTSLTANLAPDEAMAILSDYQHQIVPIIHKHSGTVDKFMGDGIMVTFGISMQDPEYCANALRCMEEILQSTKSWTGPAANVTTNIAAIHGPVIYGAVGDGDRLEFTVIGSHVNLAAKLEKKNKDLGTTALCGNILFEKAVKQGYKTNKDLREVSVSLDDNSPNYNAVVFA